MANLDLKFSLLIQHPSIVELMKHYSTLVARNAETCTSDIQYARHTKKYKFDVNYQKIKNYVLSDYNRIVLQSLHGIQVNYRPRSLGELSSSN